MTKLLEDGTSQANLLQPDTYWTTCVHKWWWRKLATRGRREDIKGGKEWNDLGGPNFLMQKALDFNDFAISLLAPADGPKKWDRENAFFSCACEGTVLGVFLHRAAAFSRCGNVFFPLRQLFGLQSWTFSAAGFFPASAGFFPCLGRVFSRLGRFFPAASKMHFFCCKGAFVLLQGVFSAALNFSRCEAAFFAGVFPAAEIAFSRCRAFFSCCHVFFPFRCFFPAANLCFSRAARRQGARERRVIHWAFATCKLDSAWTNRWQRRPIIETTVRQWKVETCSFGRSDMFQR